jgi:hypothetical protein
MVEEEQYLEEEEVVTVMIPEWLLVDSHMVGGDEHCKYPIVANNGLEHIYDGIPKIVEVGNVIDPITSTICL